jgi:hypothetical protein
MKQKDFSFMDFYDEIIKQKCQKNIMNPCGNQAVTALIVRHGYVPICDQCLGEGK